MKKTLLFTGIGILGISAMALSGIDNLAHAQDGKHYTGMECVALGSDQSDIRYNTGRAFNPTTSTRRFYCPAVLDSHALDSGSWIYLWDRNYDDDISCQLRMQNSASTSYVYSSASTSGTSPTPTKHSFGTTGFYSDGMRYVTCLVPGTYEGNQSAVVSYRIEEA